MFQKDKLNEYVNEYIIVESLLQDGRSIDQIPSYFDAAYTIKITPEELVEPLRNLYAAKLIQIDWPSEYENAKVLDEDVFANCWFGLTPLGEETYEATCDDFGLEIVYDDGTSQGDASIDTQKTAGIAKYLLFFLHRFRDSLPFSIHIVFLPRLNQNLSLSVLLHVRPWNNRYYD